MRGSNNMFQLILALTFLGMILTPAIVAARSGKKEFDPETEETAPEVTAFAAQPIRRERAAKTAPAFHSAPTLPMRRTLGMAGR
jgi:hypothetical protein